jgi:hypothetical protein
MFGDLGLTELILGGTGLLAVIAALSVGAFKSERRKRKAAEGRARAQAGLAEAEVIASKERLEIIVTRDENLSKIESDADAEKAALEAEEDAIVGSTLEDLAAKFNRHFKGIPSRRFTRRNEGSADEGPKN